MIIHQYTSPTDYLEENDTRRYTEYPSTTCLYADSDSTQIEAAKSWIKSEGYNSETVKLFIMNGQLIVERK